MYDTKHLHCLDQIIKTNEKVLFYNKWVPVYNQKITKWYCTFIESLKPCQDLIYLVLVLPSDTHHGLLCQMVESIGRSMEYLKRFYL